MLNHLMLLWSESVAAVSPGRKFSSTRLSRRGSNVRIESLEVRRLLTIMYPTFDVLESDGSSVPASEIMISQSDVFSPRAGTANPSGTTPSVMRHAYGVDVALFGSIVGDGTGQTIAIVDAYDEPTITSDLAAFDAFFGLPAPPSFTKINQNGGTTLPAADARGGWGVETALDVEWAHVIAPKANILLVEANSANETDLYTAVDTARNYPGVSVVSMSWGGDETSTDSANDFHFTTPAGHSGVTFVASSGDNGAYSGSGSTTKIVSYPAVSPNVVSIGGTFLTTGTGGTYVSESGWGSGTSSNTNGGSGGGISSFISKPSYQSAVTQSSTKRTIPDVSMNADPNSGVPVYSAYDNGAATPWLQIGGTSLSAPMWGGVMAIANQGRVQNGLTPLNGPTQTLPKLYSLPSNNFHDITTGNNGNAAATGYDLVTGIGTPIVNSLVNSLVDSTPVIGTFTAAPSSVGSGGFVTLTAANVGISTGSSTVTSVKFYRESNSSGGLQLGADILIGSGVASGTSWSLPVSTTNLSAGSYTYYAVATDSNGNSSTTLSTSVTTTSSRFSNWAGIEQAISKVSSSAGRLSSVSVVDFGTTIFTGSLDVTRTLNRIRTNGGSIDTNDGSIFRNSAGDLPSASTWYEFVVSPTTGTDRGFSSVTFPGPMRLLLDDMGDVYFTGDHYSTFVPVFLQTQAPVISTFTVSPSTISVGGSVALSANGVTQSGASISAVNFYRESNGVTGLQVGSDTYVGGGTQNGTTWAMPSVATTGLAAGSYTYFAMATDSSGALKIGSSSLVISAGASSGVLLAWDVNGQTSYGTQGLTAGNVASGVTNSLGLTRGSGITTTGIAATNAWGGNNWSTTTSAAGITGNQFVTFGLTVSAGQVASLSAIDLNYRRSASAPPSGFWQYQINSGAWVNISDVTNQFSSTSSGGAAMAQFDLSSVTGLQNISAGTSVNLRLVPYGATGSGGNWYVYDLAGNDLIVSGSIQAASTNSSPTALSLSRASVPENSAANTTVGTFTTTDPNAGDTFTYSLVTGTGSADNGNFNILGNTLRATSPFDFETKSSYSVRVQTTDLGGLSFEQTFTINVTDVTEAPVLTSPTSASIGATAATIGGTVAFDGGAPITERGVVYSLTSTNNDPVIGGTGVFKVVASGTTGTFAANLTGLTAGSGYSFKAYATNSIGTGYTSPAATFTTSASASLVTGDISILGFNANAPDGFAFVNWVGLSPATVIKFTDNGFLSSGSANALNNGRGGENFVTWTNNTGSTIPVGTVISIVDGTTVAASQGLVAQSLSGISSSGDQIFAYIGAGPGTSVLNSDFGSNANPTIFTGTLLSGLNFGSDWLSTGAATSNTSYLPSELNTVSTSRIALPTSGTTRGQYTGARTGFPDVASYKAAVANPLNWTTATSAGVITLNTIAFSLTPPPSISGQATAAAFATTYGTASAAQSFVVSGSNLTANIVVTAPPGFEVSSDGSTYAATATFVQTSGTANGTLSVRLKATAAVVGLSYNSQSIVLSSTGAASVNIVTAASGNTVAAKALTITAKNVTKVQGTSLTSPAIGSTDFTYSGTANGETVGSVTITYGTGATANDASGTYVGSVVASAATGGTFTASNYNLTYVNGDLVVNPGNLAVFNSHIFYNKEAAAEKLFSPDQTGQRSMIRNVQVVFNGNVTVPTGPVTNGSFLVAKLGTSSTNVGLTVISSSFDSLTGKTKVVVGFTNGTLTSGSLVDGNYRLVIDYGVLAIDGDGDGLAGGTKTINFHRFFGDSDGDRTVGGKDSTSYKLGLVGSSLQKAKWLSVFDWDNDGSLLAGSLQDPEDKAAFFANLGSVLNPF